MKRTIGTAVIIMSLTAGVTQAAEQAPVTPGEYKNVPSQVELRVGFYKYDGGAALYAMQDSQHFMCDGCPKLPALQPAPVFDGFVVAAEQPAPVPPPVPVPVETTKDTVATAIPAGPYAEVFFSLDSYKMSNEEKNRLRDHVTRLSLGVPVAVEGYTCKIGPKSYNMKLSMRRAKAVARYLVSLGIKVASVSWYGELKQIDGPLSANRRAVVQIKERNFSDAHIQ